MSIYTINELVPILKRGYKTILKYVKEGKLPSSKVNGRYLITDEDIKIFLEENKYT